MPGAIDIHSSRRALIAGIRIGRAFLEWWHRALVGIIPPVIVRFFGGQSSPFTATTVNGEIVLKDGSGMPSPMVNAAGILPLLEEQIAEAGLILTIPPALTLRRTIELPLAAEGELAAAMSFEVDRQTPFPVDQVYYAFRLQQRDPAHKLLRVELAVVPRETVDAGLALLSRYGLAPNSVNIDGDAGHSPFNFLPPANRRRALWRREPWKPIAIAACLVFLVGPQVVAALLDRESANLSRQIAEVQSLDQRAENLRSDVVAAESMVRFLPQKQAKSRVTEVVDALSRLLPDDTWIFDLEMDHDQVRITGFSSSVPSLMNRLQHASLFTALSLSAPVIHDAASAKDRFDITLTLRDG